VTLRMPTPAGVEVATFDIASRSGRAGPRPPRAFHRLRRRAVHIIPPGGACEIVYTRFSSTSTRLLKASSADDSVS
jgi:hypothetical protein